MSGSKASLRISETSVQEEIYMLSCYTVVKKIFLAKSTVQYLQYHEQEIGITEGLPRKTGEKRRENQSRIYYNNIKKMIFFISL